MPSIYSPSESQSLPATLVDALGDGFRSAPELARLLGVSQPTVSRMLRAAGDAVLRVGRARATRYALAAPVFGSATAIELCRMDRRGRSAQLAVLRRLRNGHFLVQPDIPVFWLLGEAGDGVFPGLPCFLEDLRPAGFLGRSIGRSLAAVQGYPPDPRDWSDELLGAWLLDHGEDAAGHILVGAGARGRAQRPAGPAVTDRAQDYPRLADASMQGGLPGSSAAGEQPKFTAYLNDIGHVIVKYSPAGNGREAQRWRDLLRCEAHALALLDAHGVPVARTTVHEFEGRVFLESLRFDRHGAIGRAPGMSLGAVAAEFTGELQSWSVAAVALQERGLMDVETVRRIAWLELFGRWIGNSDMHPGNLSLHPYREGFALNPVYDMLPMAWAPVRGELPPVHHTLPGRGVHADELWVATLETARTFWEAVEHDLAISVAFRHIATQVRTEMQRGRKQV
jgi:hypothetical protein